MVAGLPDESRQVSVGLDVETPNSRLHDGDVGVGALGNEN